MWLAIVVIAVFVYAYYLHNQNILLAYKIKELEGRSPKMADSEGDPVPENKSANRALMAKIDSIVRKNIGISAKELFS